LEVILIQYQTGLLFINNTGRHVTISWMPALSQVFSRKKFVRLQRLQQNVNQLLLFFMEINDYVEMLVANTSGDGGLTAKNPNASRIGTHRAG
jgi:hypothetical protein